MGIRPGEVTIVNSWRVTHGPEDRVVQTFSHLRQLVHVEWVVLTYDGDGSAQPTDSSAWDELCWLPANDLGQKGAGSVLQKVVDRAKAFALGEHPPPRKRKAKGQAGRREAPAQATTLHAFFADK